MKCKTRLTELLNIDIPIMSAGMAGVAGPDLVAAVSNAGGIGTIGAIGMDPTALRQCIRDTKEKLIPGKPFGVDLLLPKVGKGARATNKDYTGGQLEGLINVMIEEQIKLFVCAVGVPPKWVVEKLHNNNIIVMNMVGSPKHVKYCLEAGVDIICAQGTEAGGHTGAISTLVLLPQVVDLCKDSNVIVVGSGGVADGRGVAACLALGAQGAWVGSRFIMTTQANVQPSYQQAIKNAPPGSTIRTEIYTGRPARALRNAYNTDWEKNRHSEKISLLQQGVVPWFQDVKTGKLDANLPSPIPSGYHNYKDAKYDNLDIDKSIIPVGQVSGSLNKIQTAEEVVQEMMQELQQSLNVLQMLTAQ
jgi:NAD(P)H-dependent flavin oxidoreductase YrpB (nitropropane dioxygenase family)